MKQALFVLLIVLASACAPTAQELEERDAKLENSGPTPPAPPEEWLPNPAIADLFAMNSKVESYSFTVAKLPNKQGSHTYSVVGDLVRIDVLREPVEEQNLDTIFLNTTKRSAAGYCIQGNRCHKSPDSVPVNYDDWIITMPDEWITQAKYGENVGTLVFEKKPVTRIEYKIEGKYYEVYIDNYYGYPHRVAIAMDADITDILGGYEYRNMAFNTLKPVDVLPPKA